MRVFSAVLRKELVDNARDRRALTTALLVTPLMGPLMLVLMFNIISDVTEKAQTPKLPVIGKEYAPELVKYLEQHGTQIEAAPADPEQATRDQNVDCVLLIPADFDEKLRSGRTATVEIIGDSTRAQAGATIGNIEGMVEQYASTIGALRLIARGVDPAVLSPIKVERVETGSKQAEGAAVLAMLPMMLIIACFLGGMYVALDATAGERERQSLEALLFQPVKPLEVLLAKGAATTVFALLSIVASVAAFAVTLPLVPLESLGIVARVDLVLAARLVSLLLPLALVGSGLLLLVGTLSKSFRTAQASMSIIAIGPMIPGMITMLVPMAPKLPIVAIPALGEAILATRLMRGEDVLVVHQLALAASDLVLAAALVAIAARLFGPRLLNEG